MAFGYRTGESKMRVTRALALSILLLCLSVVAHGQDDFVGGDDFGGGDGFGGGSSGLKAGYTTFPSHDGGSGGLQQDLSFEINLLRRSHAELETFYEASQTRAIPTAERVTHLSRAEEQLHRSLSTKGDFDFSDEALDQVAAQLQEALGVNVSFDKRALEDEGIDPTTDTVRFTATGMSYRAALNHCLSQLSLTYTIEENLLTITSQSAAEEKLSTRAYVVTDLLGLPVLPQESADYDTLIDCITNIVVPNSWEAVGGAGSIREYKGMLTIAQTGEIHEELRHFQAAIREFPTLPSAEQTPEGKVSIRSLEVNEDESKTAIRKALEKSISLSFEEDPFPAVIETLASECDVTIITDEQSLEDEAFDSMAEVVTFEIKDMPASTAFALLLHDFDLTYVIRDEAVVVTSRTMAEEILRTRLYDCRPLIDASSRDPQGIAELAELESLISSTIAVSSWGEVGGPGCIEAFAQRGLLIISNTDVVHEQIERHLGMLLRGKSKSGQDFAKVKSEGPVDVTVMAYRLANSFQNSDVSDRLVDTITRMLHDSDNEVNGANKEFYIRAVGGSLVISHRRDAQDPLFRILLKMNALDQPNQSGFGTPPNGMMHGMGTGPMSQGGMGGGMRGFQHGEGGHFGGGMGGGGMQGGGMGGGMFNVK